MLDLIMNFCMEKGYEHIFLWTISDQKVARHLYNSYGFQITHTQENHEWGNRCYRRTMGFKLIKS